MTSADEHWTQDDLLAVLDNADEVWRLAAESAVTAFAASGASFTADDVYTWVGAPDHPNRMGALFHAMAVRGVIVEAGWRKAIRSSRHKSRVCVWRGATA